MSVIQAGLVLNHSQRERTEKALKALWDKRDVPHIPANEFRRLTDADLAYLHRFWAHKDKHWAEESDDFAFATQKDFREEPPQGYARMFRPLPVQPALTDAELSTLEIPRPNYRNNTGRNLTPRQATKRT